MLSGLVAWQLHGLPLFPSVLFLQCCVDLGRDVLVIGTTGKEVKFLSETEVPRSAYETEEVLLQGGGGGGGGLVGKGGWRVGGGGGECPHHVVDKEMLSIKEHNKQV